MKIEIEKKLLNNEIVKTEEFYFKIPKAIFDELNWEEGTLVEWESAVDLDSNDDDNVRVLLRNVDDQILGD